MTDEIDPKTCLLIYEDCCTGQAYRFKHQHKYIPRCRCGWQGTKHRSRKRSIDEAVMHRVEVGSLGAW